MAIEGYRQAGDIELGRLEIITRSGQQIDITELVIEVSIYQGLFDHDMICEIVFSDGTGLIDSIEPTKNEVGGFSGSDILIVEYRTPSEEVKSNRHVFITNSLSNRKRIDESLEAFIIEAVSLETFYNIDKKISRAYGRNKGNSIDNMIRSVLKEFHQSKPVLETYQNIEKGNFKVKKTFEIDSTKGIHSFVIPNMTVSDTIRFFANEADSEDIASLFTFYENTEGFKFKNIANLISQEPKAIYKYEPSNYNEGQKKATDSDLDAFKIIDFEIVEDGNLLRNMSMGMYASKNILIDTLRKKKIETIYSYQNNYKKFARMQEFAVPGNSGTDAVIRMSTTRFEHDTLSIFSAENVKPKRSERLTPIRASYHNHLGNKRVEVTVHGNSELNVGDTVFLSIPPATTNTEQRREDKYMSGKHLITTLRHKFDKESYVTVFECIKDTGIKK